MKPSLKILLAVSLLLNLFLLGYAAGYVNKKAPPPEPNPYNRMEKAFRSLPEDKRRSVQQQLNDARDLAARQMDDLRKTRAEAVEILTAPTFDAAAYTAKLNEMQDNWLNIGDHMGNTVVSLASQLNQAERKKLAAALMKGSDKLKPTAKPKR